MRANTRGQITAATSDGSIRNSDRPDRAAFTSQKDEEIAQPPKCLTSPPLRPCGRSDNLPVVFQRRPLWLFVQPVERRSRMERLVRSVLAAGKSPAHLRPPDSPIMWPARWPT